MGAVWTQLKRSRRDLWLLAITGLVLAGLVQIQAGINDTCKQTNVRHDATLNALKVGSDKDIHDAPTEVAKDEVRRRRDVTIALINAVAPKQKCEGGWLLRLVE